MMGYGWGYGLMGIWMMIVPILVIGLIVFAIIKLANGRSHTNGERSAGSNRALDILSEKFANGEIGEEEYKRKKDLLKQ